MTVTPLRQHAAAPNRRHHARPSLAHPRPVDAGANALTVSFAVTLAGEARYRDALEILDGLRQLTGRLTTDGRVEDPLDAVSLDVTPSYDNPDPVRAPHPLTVIGAVPEPMNAVDEESRPTGAIWIVPESRRVSVDGEPVPLTRIEFDLLQFLAEHPQRVFSRTQLLQQVWGYSHAGERTVDVHIRRVRAKLGDDALVTTIRGVGYRLADHVDIRLVRLH
jgi:two-component system, OmpR family, response regulator